MIAICLTLAALPAAAFERVATRDAFLATVQGKTLRYAALGVRLNVAGNGQITGSAALGTKVTGSWRWEAGYFCRDLKWGKRGSPMNCQLVEVAGDRLRFTADRGKGDTAVFRIR